MKPKTARRWLARNAWKVASRKIQHDFYNNVFQHSLTCKKVAGVAPTVKELIHKKFSL